MLEKKKKIENIQPEADVDAFPIFDKIEEKPDKDILFTLNRIIKFSKEQDEFGFANIINPGP